MTLLLAYLAGLLTLPVILILWGGVTEWRMRRRSPEYHRNAQRRHFPEYLDR